jgi:hypothetical protein
MAVLSPRTVTVLALGIGIGAALVRRREHVEPCCEKPAGAASCC